MDLVLKIVVTFVVLAGFTYLRVGRLVKRYRALRRRNLPNHMPLLACVVGALAVIPLVRAFPHLRQELAFVVTIPIAVGIGVGAGVRSGMRAELPQRAAERVPGRAR